jgi:hypothetical protein
MAPTMRASGVITSTLCKQCTGRRARDRRINCRKQQVKVPNMALVSLIMACISLSCWYINKTELISFCIIIAVSKENSPCLEQQVKTGPFSKNYLTTMQLQDRLAIWGQFLGLFFCFTSVYFYNSLYWVKACYWPNSTWGKSRTGLTCNSTEDKWS